MKYKIICLVLLLGCNLTSTLRYNLIKGRYGLLMRSSETNDVTERTRNVGMKGLYIRPSKAIEQGGGFFIPGLEDEKIRIVSVIGLILMFAVNRLGSQMYYVQLLVSEMTGVSMAILLLLQSIANMFSSPPGNSSAYLSVIQTNSSRRGYTTFEMIAREIIRSTENVNYVLAISNQQVDVELAEVSKETIREDSCKDLQAFLTSTTGGALNGRIYPMSILPVSIACNFPSSFFCVFQNINDQIWIVGSNRQEDLEGAKSWLGKLISAPV